ncbi:MAG: HlyD family efflux transporter periplasmic adaptor subunit [Planctomycetota bacterium]|nr:HlyD family efflux transporter periplasmic adaptor subunit [Planctomycetota bacterium]
MHSTRSAAGEPNARFSPRRSGNVTALLLIAMLVIGALLGVLWLTFGNSGDEEGETPILQKVVRKSYSHIVLEQGEVQSSDNFEIKCEVKNRAGGNNPSTTILDIVKEGIQVKKGDWLISFDSSVLENELRQQNILTNTQKTIVIKAKALLDTAVQAKVEYLEGTFVQEEKTIQNEIFVSTETLKKAELSYDSVKRSVARGLLDALQLEGEKFKVDAAKNDLELGNKKLQVLREFSKAKMLTQLETDIEAYEVQYNNEKLSFEEEEQKLKEIRDQIAVCKVTAPQDGQVVYANVQSSRSSAEFVVEKGAAVRERQVILRLPAPGKMQIEAKISENRINLVKEGMPVEIAIDAFGDMKLQGEVSKVNKYAEPGNWWSSNTKEYICLIQITDPPPAIRNGLTAEVRIHVDDRSDALQVPVQCVLEHRGKTFCLFRQGKNYHTKRVVFASTNDKTVAIDEQASDSIKVGDEVVMNPREHFEKFDFSGFPDLETPAPEEEAVSQQSDAAPAGKMLATSGGAE